MYYRILLIALLGLMTTACAPHGGSHYYRSEYYTADRYAHPGYYRPGYYNRGYYIAPQPRPYYSPPARYYRPAPGPHFRPYTPPGVNPHWQGNRRYDNHYNADRQRHEYRRERNRHDYRNASRYQGEQRHQDGRSLRGQRHNSRQGGRNGQR